MSQIFTKTAKGLEEIKSRAGGLSQRMRQVLIFIDGKRSRDDLHDMLKGDDMDDLLRTLGEQGLIEAIGTAQKPAPKEITAPVAAAAPATPAVAAPKPAEPPTLSEAEIHKRQREEEQQAELAMARSFMGKMS